MAASLLPKQEYIIKISRHTGKVQKKKNKRWGGYREGRNRNLIVLDDLNYFSSNMYVIVV
jgi:hypothetical protein